MKKICPVCKQIVIDKWKKGVIHCSNKCAGISKTRDLDSQKRDIIHRILENISINENGCWEWNKSKSKSGYAKIWYRGSTMRGNRVSYLAFIGDIPEGILVCHHCDNRSCINPDHLFLGTHKDNCHDSIQKCRHAHGEKSSKSKLKSEHITEIRKLYSSGISQEKISKKYNVNQSCISSIILKKTWNHI